MRRSRVISILLAVTMLATLFTGCMGTGSLPDTGKFVKACEKLGLSDYEYGDDDLPEIDDYEDGFYIYADEDAVEDNQQLLDIVLIQTGLDDIFEAENIKSFAIAAKCTGYDDIEDIEDLEDLEDLSLDGAIAFQITLDDNYAKDLMDYLADVLDNADVKVKDLSSKEFSTSKNGGYIRLHGDIATVAKKTIDDDDIRYVAKKLGGDIAASVEVSGTNVLILAGGAMNAKKASVLSSFAKAFGVTDPMGVKVNNDAVIDLIENFSLSSGASGSIKGFGGKKVGVSMPTKDLQRWNQDGYDIKLQLESAGYEVDLQYAGNKVDTQISQIEDMINSGCSVLIIAPIMGDSLGTVLEEAYMKGVAVISYDRLIMDSEYVSYYATFDNYLVGQIQGEYVRDALNLDNSSGPYTIEFTAGDPSDNNAAFFYNGAMDVLKPYIDSGKLVVLSGQVDFDAVATNEWSTSKAQARAENIYYAFYSGGRTIDAWLCSNDSTAQGVVNALESNYSGSWPVITGQDCDIVSVKNILRGKQSMSVFKDTRILAEQTVRMAIQIMEGDYVDTNSSYNNNAKNVPAYLCAPIYADINNYKTVLIDSGYYTENDLG